MAKKKKAKKKTKKTSTKKKAKRVTKKKTKKKAKKVSKKKKAKKTTKRKAKKKTKKATKKKSTKKKATKGKKRKPNKAFMKPLVPSSMLAKVVGSKPLARTEVVKKLWSYIKKNKLQDQKNRRNIHADANLKPIFRKPVVNMFEMTKLVSTHLS